jgi:ribosomal protein S27AE
MIGSSNGCACTFAILLLIGIAFYLWPFILAAAVVATFTLVGSRLYRNNVCKKQEAASLAATQAGQLLLSEHNREMYVKQLVILKNNKCPRCGALLKDGHCEYCRWMAPSSV